MSSITELITIPVNILLSDNSIEKKIAKWRKIPHASIAFNIQALNILDNYEHKQSSKICLLGQLPDDVSLTDIQSYLMELGYLEISLEPYNNQMTYSHLHIGTIGDLSSTQNNFILFGNIFEYFYSLLFSKVINSRYHIFGIFSFISYLSPVTPLALLINPNIKNIYFAKPAICSIALSLALGDIARTIYELPSERMALYDGYDLLCGSEFIIDNIPVKYILYFSVFLAIILLSIIIFNPILLITSAIIGSIGFVSYLMPFWMLTPIRYISIVILSFIFL